MTMHIKALLLYQYTNFSTFILLSMWLFKFYLYELKIHILLYRSFKLRQSKEIRYFSKFQLR